MNDATLRGTQKRGRSCVAFNGPRPPCIECDVMQAARKVAEVLNHL